MSPTFVLGACLFALALSPGLRAQEPRHSQGNEDETESPLQTVDRGPELQNPEPYTESAIKLGRRHYLRRCQSCHGYDGRALDNVDFEASDLTTPSLWLHGTSDGEVFMSIRNGAGQEMPPFQKLSDTQIWQIVHYIRSIGPKDARPSIVVEDGS